MNTGILNDKKQAPVHLATELNKVKALQVMGKYRNNIDIQQGGEHGRTALHLAAIYDHEECARILVSFLSTIYIEVNRYKHKFFYIFRLPNSMHVLVNHATMDIIQYTKQQKMQVQKQWKYFSNGVNHVDVHVKK